MKTTLGVAFDAAALKSTGAAFATVLAGTSEARLMTGESNFTFSKVAL